MTNFVAESRVGFDHQMCVQRNERGVLFVANKLLKMNVTIGFILAYKKRRDVISSLSEVKSEPKIFL